MPVAQNTREFPSLRSLLPDVRKARDSIQLLRAVCAVLVEPMRSEFQRSVAGYREDLNALLVERPAVFRALGATLLERVHHPVVAGKAGGVVKELEVRSEASAELSDVAGVIGVEELAIR